MSRNSARESIRQVGELLRELEGFTQSEKEIESARFRQTSQLRKGLEEEKEGLEKERKESLSRLEQERDEEIARVRSVLAERIKRTEKAQITVRNAVISGIQAIQGERKGALQYRFMEAGKTREKSIAEAARIYDEEYPEAVEMNSHWVRLEKQTVHALRGFPASKNLIIRSLKESEPSAKPNRDTPALQSDAEEFFIRLSAFRKTFGVMLNNVLPLAVQVFLLLAAGGLAPFLWGGLEGPKMTFAISLGVALVLSLPLLMLFLNAKSQARKFAEEAADELVAAKADRLGVKRSVSSKQEKAIEAAETLFAKEKAAFESGLVSDEEGQGGTRYAGPADVEERAARLKAEIEGAEERRIESIREAYREKVARCTADIEERLERLESPSLSEESVADLEEKLQALVSRWDKVIPESYEKLRSESDSEELGLLDQDPEQWTPPEHFESLLPFAKLRFAPASEEFEIPQSDRFAMPGDLAFDLPLRLRIPDVASILLETRQAGREEAIQFLNYLTLGWLASSPPGRLSFSLIDPVGLGESFAGLMHLSDYEEILIQSRIRTREDQIENRLGELCEHMEKVIQMYLRNDFETITQYNEAAGTIAERYHFLVIADFPHGFSELAARRLQSIATSGARCGVFLLVHSDLRGDLPMGFQMEDLRKACLCLERSGEGFSWQDSLVQGHPVELAQLPPPEQFAKWIHRIGEANRDSNRIEVPFSLIAPETGGHWTRSTAKELAVPIGRSGATKLQELALGKGTCQHALIAGKTGSGKSTLFHVIITNLALWCDPDEVEFYLIDFKKGVEFKCYADHKLPHARVIAIESDREFGLSVLQRIDQELRERGELFRQAGVQDVPGYRATEGARPLPRTLLLIDEFQEYFIEDDQISQQAAVLLDRIVRQGRAFGIHAVLGSQTLGGAFTLARATLGQMTVRIALACNEADAYLIMDDSNPAPRLLSRPGEGIYNDRAGSVEANSPFQVVWVDEKDRDERLAAIERWAQESGKDDRERVVFEGNTPGDATTDAEISRILKQGDVTGRNPRILLGAPNAIKGPTEVSFPRQNGANLLFVGSREDVVEALLPISLGLLRAQLGDTARLIVIHPGASDENSEMAQRIQTVSGVETPKLAEIDELLAGLSEEMKEVSERGDATGAPSIFLFIPSLQRHKKLRYEEDFGFSMEEDTVKKPSASLNELICEGPGWGYHVIASFDSLNNVHRCLGRKAAGEFEKKVLFQMSATDSASLVDSSAASALGLNRALYYDEAEGQGEVFRPYAEPSLAWLSENFRPLKTK
ncbi:MAG: FtsK/SpoIIIE domain-containing protein [Verrucomicrobiales bacterium]|nr:FtsK/SpoIIIE domain-containing protein [Verrucomicrobiales bacterium]